MKDCILLLAVSQNLLLCALNGCIEPPCVHLLLLPAEVNVGFERNNVRKIKDILAHGAVPPSIRKHVPRINQVYFYGHIVHIFGV